MSPLAFPSHSRRSFIGLSTAAAIAGLTACGTQDAPSASAGGGSTAGAGFPVEVEHQFGTTVVKSRPKRVVSVGYTEQDTLLALGVMPVALTDWYGDQPYATWPWAQDELGDAKPTVLSISNGFEVEKIVGLRPDLIVGTNAGMKQKDYELLSKIAPTVAQSGEYTDFFEPWSVQTTAIGTALGLGTEAKALVGDVGATFAKAKAANPAFAGKKAIFLQNAVYDGSVIAYQNGLSTDFLTDLGFTVPASLDKYAKGGGQAYVPLENLDELNAADVLIWATEVDKDRAALERAPGFLDLEPVRAGRSLYTGGELAGAIYFTSPLSLPYVVDQLTPMLARAFAD